MSQQKINQMEILRKKNSCHLDLDKFIQDWNNKYPYDRWWRKKYNIPFGSKLHKQASFIEMAYEYKEDMYYYKLKEQEDENDGFEDIVNKNPDDSQKKVIKMSKKELDTEFADLNLDDFNDK